MWKKFLFSYFFPPVLDRIELNERMTELCIFIKPNRYLQYTENTTLFDLFFKLNDPNMLLNNRRLNIRYQVKMYYLCNNDSYQSINSSTASPYSSNNCATFEISTLIVDAPQTIKKMNNQLLRKGKYALVIEPKFFNSSKYCENINECPYLDGDRIHCGNCSKIVYFIDLASFKSDKVISNKPNDTDMTCLRNSNKYSKLSSFLALTVLDSFEGSLISYQNSSIFNTNEAYLVSSAMSISVSLDLAIDTQCNPINLHQILEIQAGQNDSSRWRNSIFIRIAYMIASAVTIFVIIFGVTWLLNYNLESFCKYHFVSVSRWNKFIIRNFYSL